MRTGWLRLVVPTLILLLAAEVAAHIPVASFMLDRLAKQRAKHGFRRLKVTLRCGDSGQQGKVETLYLKVPGLVRRERASAVEICRNGTCWRKRRDAGKEKLPRWSFLPYLYFVELDSTGQRYLELLRSLKVDTRVDTFSRFHSRIAIIYGAKNWERDRPQFWLDKDVFLPLRLMIRDGPALVDIRWIGWGSKVAGDWFPERLEIVRDGRPVERCEVTEVKSGVSMPDSLFQL